MNTERTEAFDAIITRLERMKGTLYLLCCISNDDTLPILDMLHEMTCVTAEQVARLAVDEAFPARRAE